MAFKMRGHTLPGINQRMDKSSKPDGRAKSSAFQKEGEKDEVVKGGTLPTVEVSGGKKTTFDDKNRPMTNAELRDKKINPVEGTTYYKNRKTGRISTATKASPAKQTDPDVKRVISSGKVGGKETTMYTKGARPGVGGQIEKGRHVTYTKQDDDTYTKKVETSPKGATSDKQKVTKKEKTISTKRAERQIERKTRRAERSDKKARRKEVRGVLKQAKEAGVDKKERRAMKKFAKKAIKNR